MPAGPKACPPALHATFARAAKTGTVVVHTAESADPRPIAVVALGAAARRLGLELQKRRDSEPKRATGRVHEKKTHR